MDMFTNSCEEFRASSSSILLPRERNLAELSGLLVPAFIFPIFSCCFPAQTTAQETEERVLRADNQVRCLLLATCTVPRGARTRF